MHTTQTVAFNYAAPEATYISTTIDYDHEHQRDEAAAWHLHEIHEYWEGFKNKTAPTINLLSDDLKQAANLSKSTAIPSDTLKAIFTLANSGNDVNDANWHQVELPKSILTSAFVPPNQDSAPTHIIAITPKDEANTPLYQNTLFLRITAADQPEIIGLKAQEKTENVLLTANPHSLELFPDTAEGLYSSTIKPALEVILQRANQEIPKPAWATTAPAPAGIA